MESIEREPESDNRDTDERTNVGTRASPRQKTKASDRVALDGAEVERLSKWLSQINELTNGFLVLSRSDLVNFLIRSHQDALTPKEIAQVSAHHYDPLRHIAWIAPQIKVALESGDFERVAKLQDELRNVKLTSNKSGDHQPVVLPAAEQAKKRPKRAAKLEPGNVIPPMEITAEEA